MSEEMIDEILQRFAQHRERQTETSPKHVLTWHMLQEGDIGLLRACIDPDGDLLLQELTLRENKSRQICVARAILPRLLALLQPTQP